MTKLIEALREALKLALYVQQQLGEAQSWVEQDDDTDVPDEWDLTLRNEMVELHYLLDIMSQVVPALPVWVLFDDRHMKWSRGEDHHDPHPWLGEFTKEKAEEWAEAYRQVLPRDRDWQVRKGFAAFPSIYHPDLDEHMVNDRLTLTKWKHAR